VSVRDGTTLAERTWNGRLGIVGGLSILGTTGIVVPYSCAAWIATIQQGVDVARALRLDHVVGSTGDTSERAAMARLGLPVEAYLDMGDFVGGLLKYLRRNPVARLTIAGGFGKLTKLAQGAMDLHSHRSRLDHEALARLIGQLGGDAKLQQRARTAGSANEVLALAQAEGVALADAVARQGQAAAQAMVGDGVRVDVLVIDRDGRVVGVSG
jgi:cobalt-precorrin-5B (C1)-methyltransferase